jgi:hypothetical protein
MSMSAPVDRDAHDGLAGDDGSGRRVNPPDVAQPTSAREAAHRPVQATDDVVAAPPLDLTWASALASEMVRADQPSIEEFEHPVGR